MFTIHINIIKYNVKLLYMQENNFNPINLVWIELYYIHVVNA